MLGDGLACYDLDHCLTGNTLAPWARKVLDAKQPLWVERSMSGDGLHIFIRAEEAKGWKRAGVEYYSRARFIAVTGDHWTG